MGIRASHTGEVIFDNCRIPGRCLLGGKEKLDERLARAREGKHTSSQAAMATFESTRPSVGAQAIGIARAAYEYSLDYAKERQAFGRAIIENQGIAFKFSDMRTRIDASRLLVWRASWMGATGKPFTAGEGSMSKLFAGETAVWVTEQAIQVMGGYGLRPRAPGRALAPRLQDLHDLRRHLRDTASGHRPSRLGRAYTVTHLGVVFGPVHERGSVPGPGCRTDLLGDDGGWHERSDGPPRKGGTLTGLIWRKQKQRSLPTDPDQAQGLWTSHDDCGSPSAVLSADEALDLSLLTAFIRDHKAVLPRLLEASAVAMSFR